MGKRTLQIVLTEFLPRGPWPLCKMVVEARANIGSNPRESLQWARADTSWGVNPTWNKYSFNFTLNYSSTFDTFQDFLNVELYNIMPDGTMYHIGGVKIHQLSNWVEAAGEEADEGHFSCGLDTGGTLRLSYRLGEYESTVDLESISTFLDVVGTFFN